MVDISITVPSQSWSFFFGFEKYSMLGVRLLELWIQFQDYSSGEPNANQFSFQTSICFTCKMHTRRKRPLPVLKFNNLLKKFNQFQHNWYLVVNTHFLFSHTVYNFSTLQQFLLSVSCCHRSPQHESVATAVHNMSHIKMILQDA